MNRFNAYTIIAVLILLVILIFSIRSCSKNKNHAGELSYEKSQLVIDTGVYRDNLGKVHRVVNKITIQRNTLLSSNTELLSKNKLLFDMAEYYKRLSKNKNTGTLIGITTQTSNTVPIPALIKINDSCFSGHLDDGYLIGDYMQCTNTRYLEYNIFDTLVGSINNRIKEPVFTFHPFHIKLFNRTVIYKADFTLKNPRSKINSIIITDIVK
jgi:hypothetical protein